MEILFVPWVPPAILVAGAALLRASKTFGIRIVGHAMLLLGGPLAVLELWAIYRPFK